MGDMVSRQGLAGNSPPAAADGTTLIGSFAPRRNTKSRRRALPIWDMSGSRRGNPNLVSDGSAASFRRRHAHQDSGGVQQALPGGGHSGRRSRDRGHRRQTSSAADEPGFLQSNAWTCRAILKKAKCWPRRAGSFLVSDIHGIESAIRFVPSLMN